MNIEAYNLDSLRKLVRSLQDENKRLKEQLDKAYTGENHKPFAWDEKRWIRCVRSVSPS